MFYDAVEFYNIFYRDTLRKCLFTGEHSKMKKSNDSLSELLGEIPLQVQMQTRMSVEIAHRIEDLMRRNGYSKKQFAENLGRRPSEITKWLSGEHNFTIATLARLSAFFGEPIISVAK